MKISREPNNARPCKDQANNTKFSHIQPCELKYFIKQHNTIYPLARKGKITKGLTSLLVEWCGKSLRQELDWHEQYPTSAAGWTTSGHPMCSTTRNKKLITAEYCTDHKSNQKGRITDNRRQHHQYMYFWLRVPGKATGMVEFTSIVE